MQLVTDCYPRMALGLSQEASTLSLKVLCRRGRDTSALRAEWSTRAGLAAFRLGAHRPPLVQGAAQASWGHAEEDRDGQGEKETLKKEAVLI